MEWGIWIATWFYSVSVIQDNIEYIIKNHEILPALPLNNGYINRINNKLELQTPEQWSYLARQKN